MSFNEDASGDDADAHQSKKRRTTRACDICRTRKRRCDGEENDKCWHCMEGNLECTYLNVAPKRPPPRSSEMRSLELELQAAKDEILMLRTQLASARSGSVNGGIQMAEASLQVLRSLLDSLNKPRPPPPAEDLEFLNMTERFEKMHVGATGEVHFVGKSSSVALLQATMEVKAEVDRLESGNPAAPVAPHWRRRPEYWSCRPWQNPAPAPPFTSYVFPPLSLILTLSSLYFSNVNTYLPLLHRPSFERRVNSGEFLNNRAFGATVLLVCAIAARWHPDPSCGAPAGGVPSTASGLMCGWAWFSQVPLMGRHVFTQATLEDLQHYCLAVAFLNGASAPQASWNLIGMGLRVAQDLGVHRRRTSIERPTPASEQLKRAFWVLVYYDRVISCTFGRACALEFSDFDAEPLIECDDEYWDDPDRPFQQPAGVPSTIAYFNVQMRLLHIMSLAARMLYHLGSSRIVFGIDDSWEEALVTEFDSAMNVWMDSIPDHLRWANSSSSASPAFPPSPSSVPTDPDTTEIFLDQTVALQCLFYYVQSIVHRPFIPAMRLASPDANPGASPAPSVPSVTIITNAARACANAVDVQRRRKGENVPVLIHFSAVLTAANVLLLNVWTQKRAALRAGVAPPDLSRDLANARKCLDVIKLSEQRWQHSGILGDILDELIPHDSFDSDKYWSSKAVTPDLAMPFLIPYTPSDPLWSTLNRAPQEEQGFDAFGSGWDAFESWGGYADDAGGFGYGQ
ncbi:Zn(2)-C6 fungal-type domain-containing protein [Mycena kentingensis (nom. inval.)]|nr:Zn(2)-C6 fungal-type domain-containing protein [Mycena kentingensis (nom. inval.)]